MNVNARGGGLRVSVPHIMGAADDYDDTNQTHIVYRH